MTEFIENIFSTIFGDNVVLATILIAIVPVIELKGAIPFSMSVEIWGANALSFGKAFLFGFLGSSLIVPLLALVYKPIIELLKKTKLFKNLAHKIEEKINKRKDKIEQKTLTENMAENKKKEKRNKMLKILSVFLFVAIPLPFTGVWTGTCLAVALNLGFLTSCLTVVLGNLVAGSIISLVSCLFGDSTMIFFYAFVALIVVFGLFFLIRHFVKKHKQA